MSLLSDCGVNELQRGASQYNLRQSPGWNVVALTPAVGAAEAGKTPGTVKYIQVSQRQVMPQ